VKHLKNLHEIHKRQLFEEFVIAASQPAIEFRKLITSSERWFPELKVLQNIETPND
jgi:hypothetical protein